MHDITISSIHRYSTRFLRSTDLVRDFYDPNGLEGYKLTDFGNACLKRIADGFRPNSSRRAWRLTGDFGSGKSSFALLLANSLRDTKKYLPMELSKQVLKNIPETKHKKFIPVLVMGNREPIAFAIIRSLYDVLLQTYTRGTKSELLEEIERVVHQRKVSDQKALTLLQEAKNKIIQNGKGCGILLIMDEVGKFLEFAALNPEQQDVFFLQQLAELASRSGNQPLLIICLLHQGFNAYSEQLAQSTQREWEKVAGRFEEILFQQPLDQIALLVASAIRPDIPKIHDSLKSQAASCLTKAIELGWYGTSASRETLHRLSAQLFPLDPMLLPVLVRIFQRYGQNERSLFSFLCSHEPFGLLAFSQQILNKKTRPFQLSDFYDYVRANFGHKLAVVSHRTHWTVIESVIEAHNPDNPLELRILKTIGILNLLDVDDLRPTKEAIKWAVGGKCFKEHNEVLDVLRVLVERRILYFRGDARGYSLWPYTSVDIESRMDEAKKAIPSVGKISEAIAEQLDAHPIVARAHYIRTGNLRYFDVVYCKPEELMEQAKKYQTSADGFILVPLCETDTESKSSMSVAKDLVPRRDLIRIIAVPRALVHLNQAALDALRWEWVQKNTPELNNDRFAREEVYLNSQEVRNRLQSQVQQFIGLNRITGQSSLRWFYFDKDGMQAKTFCSGRQALRILSDLCDQVYEKAPQIKNELANRHSLSSAAIAARMRLLELMFVNADKPDLGLPQDRKPPEKSMYLSIFRKTKLHQEIEGKWVFAIPARNNDQSNVAPTLKKIKDYLSSQVSVITGACHT